jgi:hypothetical protein
VLDELAIDSHYGLRALLGEDAFYEKLEDVMKDYQK